MSKDLGTQELVVVGEYYPERLFKAIREECKYKGTVPPTYAQIGCVLRALADHTTIMAAANYDKRELHPYQDKVTEFWPTETSIGRFFRDTALAYYDMAETEA